MITVAVGTLRECSVTDITLVILRHCVKTACESLATEVALVIVIAVRTYTHDRAAYFTFVLTFLADGEHFPARVTLMVVVLILAFREGGATGVALVVAVLVGALAHLLGAHVAFVVGV